MSRKMKLAGNLARMGLLEEFLQDLVGKPEGKRPLGRRRGRWEDNIKMCRRIGWYGQDLSDFG
jgi:hypothetical protein